MDTESLAEDRVQLTLQASWCGHFFNKLEQEMTRMNISLGHNTAYNKLEQDITRMNPN